MAFTTCETKTFLDTEFEAEVFAAKKSHQFNKEFIHYRCRNHWHIAHKNPEESIGFGRGYWRCPGCKVIEKKSKREEHICTQENT